MIWGGVAAATALTGTASAFWNFFGVEAEAPAPVQAPRGQEVKAEFNNASVQDVLNWLKKQGVNFVVETTDIKDRRLSLSVSATTREALMEAVADALGFSVTKKDGTYILKKASPFGSMNWETKPDRMFFNDGKPLSDKERAEIEKKYGEGLHFVIPPMNLDPEKQKEWEKEWKNQWKDFDGFKFSIPPMDEKERAKWEKEWKDNVKVFGDGKIYENGKAREMTKEEKAKLEEKMKAWGESFKDFDFEKIFDGENFKILTPDKMSKEEKAEFEKEMKKLHENLKELPGKIEMPRFTIKAEGIAELKKSLTESQKELMKKQGYLKPGDLTEAQRKILNLDSMKGDFSISFSDDGMSITIKNK